MALPVNNKLKHQVRNLCEEVWPRLIRIAMSWGCNRELAHDLVQQTCVNAMEKHHQVRNPDAIESWIISILNNNHKYYLRGRRDTVDIDELCLVSVENTEMLVDHENILNHVRQAISKMNIDQRKILTLVDMEGMSYTEVAGVLGLKMGTVMSRLSRARSQLKLQLESSLHPSAKDKCTSGVIRKIK